MQGSERLGARLREARLAMGLTQTQVAEGIVTGAFLSLIESGQRTPSPKVAAALAARLRLPLDDDATRTPEDAAILGADVALRLGDREAAAKQLAAIPATTPIRWLFEGLLAEQTGDFDTALRCLDDAANSPALAPDVRLRAKVALCRCSRDAGDLFRSIEVGERTLADVHADPHADRALLDELRATLSGTYCETGDLFRAHELTAGWNRGSDDDSWTRAMRCWSRSMVLQTAGEYAEARALAGEALELLKTLDRPRSLAYLQNTSAWITMHTLDFDAAQVDFMLRDAERTFREMHAPIDLATVLSSRAELATRTGQRDLAVRLIGEAMTLAQGAEAGLRARLAAIAAQVYSAAGEVNRAMQLLLGARALLEDAGANRSAAATWRHMAHTYEELGELDLTVACLKAATDLLGLQPPLQARVQQTHDDNAAVVPPFTEAPPH